MRINARKAWWSGALVAILTIGVCLPVLCLEQIPGTFSLGTGIAYGTEQTTTWGGSGGVTTSTGATQTKLCWSADYQYPLGKLRVGAALLNWKFDAVSSSGGSSGGTSLCGMFGFMLKPDQEVYLGAGPQIVRIGGRFYRGKGAKPESGMYLSAEFDAPLNSNDVNSFGSFGVGYSF